MTAMDAESLDADELETYMRGFLGYGNPKAPVWLVGIEEGAGRCVDEIRRRIGAWHTRGQKPFEDVRDYHEAFELTEAFDENARVQPTWGPLIRMMLIAKGVTPNDDLVLDIQRLSWARADCTICLSELLPLPKRVRGDWKYNEWAPGRTDLVGRRIYERTWMPIRAEILEDALTRWKPKLVVFYGTAKDFRRSWSQLAGGELLAVDGQDFWRRDAFGRSHLLVEHPSPARPKPKEYFARVGAYLRGNYDHELFEGFGS